MTQEIMMTTGAETETRNWAKLDSNLLFEIASRIQLWEDLVSFAGVCTSWRSEAADPQIKLRYNSSQIPWLIFPQKASVEDHNNLVVNFFSLSKGMSRPVTLPESANYTRYFSSRGCLIKISPDFSVSALHPSSRTSLQPQLHFPNLKNLAFENRITSFPDMTRDLEIWNRDITRYYSRCILKCVLSSSSSSNIPPDSGSAPVFMMIIYGYRGRLAFARAGDRVWRGIKNCTCNYQDVIYYKNQFYAINYRGQVYAIEGKFGREVARFPLEFYYHADCLYLVESDGALLVVSRRGSQLRAIGGGISGSTYGTYDFSVFELDLSINIRWTKLKSLGTKSLFLGHNSSLSIEASNNSHCKPNCIYFADDDPESYWLMNLEKQTGGGGMDMGIYSMEDGNIERFFETNPCHMLNPPMWVEHIF